MKRSRVPGSQALTEAQRAEVVRRYEAGEQNKVIARTFGISHVLVSEIARSRGAKMKGRGSSALSGAGRAELARAYRAGASLRELHERHHVSTRYIRDVLRAAGVPLRRPGSVPGKLVCACCGCPRLRRQRADDGMPVALSASAA